ncbi:TPA: LPXTG cell wall anchor domain-containing protein [Streptococcus suis]
MKRKKKYKHAYKCRQKLMLLVGATTMAVGAVTMGQVLSVQAEDTVPEPIVTEVKDSSLASETPPVVEEGQPSLSQTGNATPVETTPQTGGKEEQAGALTERSASGAGAILIETSEKSAPVISDLQTQVTRSFDDKKFGRVVAKMDIGQIEQPALVTFKLHNKETGEVSVQTAPVEEGTTGEIWNQYPVADFGKVAPGTYRLEVTLSDLENKPYELDEKSQAILANLPDIEIPLEEPFVEPNLVEVKVDKTTVKKGEQVTYTFVYDGLASASLDLTDFDLGWLHPETISLSTTNGTGFNWLTGRAKVFFNGSFSEAGDYKLTFDTDKGYYDSTSFTNTKIASISKANIEKLAQLMPTVTVLDEDYQSAEVLTLTHVRKDGSREVLPPLANDWASGRVPTPNVYYHKLHTLQAGDQLVYRVRIAPELLTELQKKEWKWSEYASLTFGRVTDVVSSEEDGYTYNYDASFSITSNKIQTREFELVLPIEDYMHGYFKPNLPIFPGNSEGVHDPYRDYLFHIDNPNPTPLSVELAGPKKLYVGERNVLKARVKGIGETESFKGDFDFGIKPNTSTGGDEFDFYAHPTVNPNWFIDGWVYPEWSLLTFVDYKEGLKAEEIGTYSLKRASIVGIVKRVGMDRKTFNTGIDETIWSTSTVELPSWNIEVSGEKVFKTGEFGADVIRTGDYHPAGFLLSGEERTAVATVGFSKFDSFLKRLPKELQNRPLYVHKFHFYDSQGQELGKINAELLLGDWYTEENLQLYYYSPSSGQVEELTPVSEDSRLLVKGVKDSKGLYIFAKRLDGTEPMLSSVDSTKVLSNSLEDIYVTLSDKDVSAVGSIQAIKVTDDAVFEKLPPAYNRNDVDMFDIKTLDKDGQFVQIQSNKGALVTLPVSPNRKVTKVIYYLPQTGAVEELEYDWDKTFNIVSFKVSHFSNYAIVYEGNAENPQSSGTTSGTGNNTSPETGGGSTSTGNTTSDSGNSASPETGGGSISTGNTTSDSGNSTSPEIGGGSTSAGNTASGSGNNTSPVDSVDSVLVGSLGNGGQLDVNRREEVSAQPTNATVEQINHVDSKVTRTRKVNALPNTAAQTGVVATVLGLALATLASFVQKKREE